MNWDGATTAALWRRQGERRTIARHEGRKRVIGVMAAILASLHMQTADDLFGGPQGSPRSDAVTNAGYCPFPLASR
jgi:hypothetical protein